VKVLETIIPTPLGWVGAATTARGVFCATLPADDEDGVREHLAAEVRREIRRRGRRAFAQPETAAISPEWGAEWGATERGPAAVHVKAYRDAIDRYMRGDARSLDLLPLDLEGLAAFHRDAMLATREIPFGETRSYGWVAHRAGRPGAARAVGTAMSRNPLPLLIPCHRVVPASGGIGRFGGSEPLKERLLRHEGWTGGAVTPAS
jgi:O-6-methylguanine DNA methyltransferase